MAQFLFRNSSGSPNEEAKRRREVGALLLANLAIICLFVSQYAAACFACRCGGTLTRQTRTRTGSWPRNGGSDSVLPFRRADLNELGCYFIIGRLNIYTEFIYFYWTDIFQYHSFRDNRCIEHLITSTYILFSRAFVLLKMHTFLLLILYIYIYIHIYIFM